MLVQSKLALGFSAFAFLGSVFITSPALGETLSSQIQVLQQRMEQTFEEAPSVVERVYSSSTSNTLVDYSDLADSALLTGAYLASQCFREAAATDAQDKTDAENQILWALGSIENLFTVTGTSGALARFAFNTSELSLKNLEFAKTASAKTGWTASKALPGWLWMGNTSRDQYTGVLFGLGMCNQLSMNASIKARTAAEITAAVTYISKNKWIIPGTTGTSSQISLDTQAGWLKLAEISSTTAAAKLSWSTLYKNTMTSLMTNLTNELQTELNPTIVNDFEEYYAWNLGYMRLYPQLLYETNPTYIAYLKNNMTTKMWEETWNHGNSEFTFMKIGTMGVQSSRDQMALTQALASLNELAARNRRDFPVINKANAVGGLNTSITGLTNFISTLGISSDSFLNPVQAADPIPMSSRIPIDYMWLQSPFLLVGGGTGTIEAPSVDTIFAYWLGQYHHLLNGQVAIGSGTGSTPSTVAKPVATPAPSVPSKTGTGTTTTLRPDTGATTPLLSTETGTIVSENPAASTYIAPTSSVLPTYSGHGYDNYRMELSGTNYVGSLDYHGTVSATSESAQALSQSYSGVLQAGSMFFSTMQADILKVVNDEVSKLPGSHTTSVELGNSLGITLKGQETYSNINFQLPTITASVGVKIEKLFGLIVIQCNETISIANASVTGQLNVTSGTLTNIDIHSTSTGTTHCSDNIPIFGSVIADLLSHFAQKAINPTLAKFNAPGGYPLKSDNFSGINKLLKPGTFVVNGQDYGSTLAKDIGNFFNTSEIDISIHNPQPLPPGDRGDAFAHEKASTVQPIFTMNLPDNNISLNILEQQLYSAVGTWHSGDEP